MTRCQLIIDPPGAGSWNMAVDECLLAAAADEGLAALRFYQWKEPTLSLGYFQSYDDRRHHPASAPCPVVRRQSGGGAILHDCELTYSLTMPSGHPLARDAQQLYSAVHQTLASALKTFGVPTRIRDVPEEADQPEEPFLCFLRRGHGDLLWMSADSSRSTAAKIAGSAQRRRRGALLQHGSVLLGRSPAAPELSGIGELSGVSVSPAQLVDQWKPELMRRLGGTWQQCPLPERLHREASGLEVQRYATRAWVTRR